MNQGQKIISVEISMDQLVCILGAMSPPCEVKGDIARHKTHRLRPHTTTYIGASSVQTTNGGDCLLVGPSDDVDYVMGLIDQSVDQ